MPTNPQQQQQAPPQPQQQVPPQQQQQPPLGAFLAQMASQQQLLVEILSRMQSSQMPPTPSTPNTGPRSSGAAHGGGNDVFDEIKERQMMSKLLDTPELWEGPTATQAWAEWRFRFMNWLSMTQPQELVSELRWSESSPVPVFMAMDWTEQQRQRCQKSYGIISSLIRGKHIEVIMSLAENREGFEVWRQISLAEEPKSYPATLEKVRLVLRFKIDSSIERWQASVAHFERLVTEANRAAAAEAIGPILKLAILLEGVPAQIATQIQLSIDSSSSYEAVKLQIEKFIRSIAKSPAVKKAQSQSQPMDVDSIHDNVTCYKCRGRGHIAKNCPGGGGAQQSSSSSHAPQSSSASSHASTKREGKGGKTRDSQHGKSEKKGGKGGKGGKGKRGKGKGKGGWIRRVHVIDGQEEEDWQWEDWGDDFEEEEEQEEYDEGDNGEEEEDADVHTILIAGIDACRQSNGIG